MDSFHEVLLADLSAGEQEGQPLCRVVGRTLDNNVVLGRFAGAVGLARCKELHAALRGLLTENLQKVILDLAEVTMTPSAMGVLVAFAAEVQGRDKRLYLYRASEQIRALVDDLQLTYFFSFLTTEDDLLATRVV